MAGAFVQKSRHQTIYYFRRKVPLDLRARLGKTQIYLSLGTQVRSDALALARRVAVRSDDLFALARTMATDKTFNDTPLGRLIAERKITAPLKEEIQRLRDEAIDREGHNNKQIAKIKKDNNEQLIAVAAGVRGIAAPSSTPSPQTTPGLTIAEGIARFLGRKNLTGKTKKRYSSALEHFREWAGASTAMHGVTQAYFSEYADKVTADPTRADKTKVLYITTAASLFRTLRTRDATLPEISAAGLKPTRERPSSLDRAEFTLEQLGVIFKNAAQVGKRDPHRFWVTVAIAFLGCRLQELAQADLNTDILFDDKSEQWYLKVTEDAAPGGLKKSVKTLAGWRVVPIHSALVRHGFIDYLKTERKAGATTLFDRHWKPHELEAGKPLDYAHTISKWGSRTLMRLVKTGAIVGSNLTYFHSMRHSFVSHLDRKGVPEDRRAALVGQEFGGINATVYSKLRMDLASKIPIIEDNFDEYVSLLDACA